MDLSYIKRTVYLEERSYGKKKKNNFYAVKIGVKPGIYSSWDECKAQVSGFSGALYKGFVTKHEAEKYLSGEFSSSCELENKVEQEADAIIYVDGSFDEVTGTYGYGCIILSEDRNIKNLYGAGNNRDTARLRNVAGEMLAAMHAVRYAIKNNLKIILICYDYAGIEFWATGRWKTKNDLTAKYANAMRKWEEDIEIRFQKVTAHTGVKYNELADQLAKFAVNSFNNKAKVETVF